MKNAITKIFVLIMLGVVALVGPVHLAYMAYGASSADHCPYAESQNACVQNSASTVPAAEALARSGAFIQASMVLFILASLLGALDFLYVKLRRRKYIITAEAALLSVGVLNPKIFS